MLLWFYLFVILSHCHYPHHYRNDLGLGFYLIIGATSIEQLNKNLGALNVKLAADEMTVLDKLTEWKVDEE